MEFLFEKGMSNSAGVKRQMPKIATEDADVVKKTRLAGGIPLLVSNTPELCFCWETYNNVTGATKNPYDSRRTSGGSSGGEVRNYRLNVPKLKMFNNNFIFFFSLFLKISFYALPPLKIKFKVQEI